MAALAFVAAVLLSQIDQNNAAQGPFTDQLPCGDNCNCVDLGYTVNASAASSSLTSDYYKECCAQPANKPCIEWAMARRRRGARDAGCGTGKDFDFSKMQTAAGATDATAQANCCSKALVVTCAQVTCNSRRRRDAEYYKAKTGVDASTCTDNDNCETTCCEKDTTLCGASTSWCGVGKRKKQFETYTCSNGQETDTYTAAAKMSAATADFEANCCEDQPLCSTFTCPAHMQAKTTADLKWEKHAVFDCCENKATACVSLCLAGSAWGSFGSDNCGQGRTSYCTGGPCTDANTAVNIASVFATDATAAEKKTACCVSTPVTCADYTALVETAKAAAGRGGSGSTSAARFNRASAAVSALVALAVVFAL